uniref:C3H1-type domain-containing protein n=1 Tax=Panagrolaimus sp. ES5 TaxID=591445 RepID=A0AC34FWY8_9BILA
MKMLTKCRKEKNQVYGQVLTHRAEINQLKKDNFLLHGRIAFKNQELTKCFEEKDQRIEEFEAEKQSNIGEIAKLLVENDKLKKKNAEITEQLAVFGLRNVNSNNSRVVDHDFDYQESPINYCGTEQMETDEVQNAERSIPHNKGNDPGYDSNDNRLGNDNENDGQEVIESHEPTNQPSSSGSISVRVIENYEIHSNENGQKELIIFENEEKTKCSRYAYFSKKTSLFNCKFTKCRNSAEICKNKHGKEYVKAQWPHKYGCQPSEYFKSIEEDGFEFCHGQLVIFVKESNEYDRSQYYKYYFDISRNRGQCSNCKIMKKHVQAIIWIDENGKKYVQLHASHVCQPIQS